MYIAGPQKCKRNPQSVYTVFNISDPDSPVLQPIIPAPALANPAPTLPHSTATGKCKVSKVNAARAEANAAAKAAAVKATKSYHARAPQKGSDGEKALVIARSPSWTVSWQMILVAIGLAKTDDEAATYPVNKGALCYRPTEHPGKYT
ncbi:hypothetical protein AURDEDRAFT_131496 [Auricularia subglabra TFB-10046 SS5]|uniref:Uncharacterized protein n=1 Tax=Auricularia subglabra (strain TFB-10046 / SS5) TaxID=717982 RepID=J0WPL0_AURST|nr:hypothetical protein AURDEDRAFT_131496 [Auricularia subglabra TFB-10046 SS5]